MNRDIAPRSRRLLTAFPAVIAFVLLSLLMGPAARAQWASESYTLTAGWNGVWLPLDCTYDEISKVLTDTRIQEVWRWNPPGSTMQFTTSPQLPVAGDVQWNTWVRATPTAPFSTLFALTGNSAYLFKVADSVGQGTVAVTLKGKPLPPRYPWRESGTNLFGFPVTGTTSLESFFSYSATLNANPPIFTYLGGAGLPAAPARVTSPRTTSAERGKAYWVQSGTYTDYYGPLKLTATSSALDFGADGYVASLRLKNVTGTSLSATLTSITSLAPPTVIPALPVPAGAVPLKVRGLFNPVSGTYAYEDLPKTISLAPGADVEVVLSLQRNQMGTVAGADFQSVLRITDSLGVTRLDLPAHAVTTSLAGVWAGNASLDQVDQVVGANITPNSPRPVGTAFPVRFLVHMDNAGHATLVQQVYLGSDASGNRIAATRQGGTTPATLDQTQLATASRLSSASFPVGQVTVGTGALGLTGSATFVVALAANASTNPFLHIYHPDHGPAQSYTITRKITMAFDSVLAANDPTFGSTTLGGIYTDHISGLRAQGAPDAAFPLKVLDPQHPETTSPGVGLHATGRFVLRRVANLPTLNK